LEFVERIPLQSMEEERHIRKQFFLPIAFSLMERDDGRD